LKIALYLEETGLLLRGRARGLHARGEQHLPVSFLWPSTPTPKNASLVDGDAVVFDSNAILLYPRKTDQFLPDNHASSPHNKCCPG
jgi:GST-like protein